MTLDHLASARTWRRGLLGLAMVAAGLSLTAMPATAAPSVAAGGPYTGAEGQHVAIQGTAGGASSVRWSAARAPGGEQDHAKCTFADPTALSTQVWCNDDGWFDLTLTGNDGSTSTTRLTLTNVRPMLTRVTPPTGTAVGTHSVVKVSASYRDPGPIDSHKYVISWGDGTTSRAPTRELLNGTGSFSGSHSYQRPGHHKVTVTVFDSHGGSDHRSHALQVVGGSCMKVNGAGRLPGHRSSHFFLAAHCVRGGAVGAVRLRVPGSGRFVATRLTLLRGHGHAATLAGVGRWQSAGSSGKGYGFVISVKDRGGRDKMTVSVRTPRGALVLHARGAIAGGNVTVHR